MNNTSSINNTTNTDAMKITNNNSQLSAKHSGSQTERNILSSKNRNSRNQLQRT